MQTKLRSSSRKLLPTIIDETMDRNFEPIPTTQKLAQVAEHSMPRLTHATKLNFVCAKLVHVSDDSEAPYDIEASLMFSEYSA